MPGLRAGLCSGEEGVDSLVVSISSERVDNNRGERGCLPTVGIPTDCMEGSIS